MFGTVVTRKELLQVTGASTWAAPNGVTELPEGELPQARQPGIVLLWSADPRKIKNEPILFVVPQNEIDDLLAWTSSYLSDYRPLTSFFRVLSYEEYNLVYGRGAATPRLTFQTSSACVGLILAETALHIVRTGGSLERLSLNACFSSLSYSFGRSLLAGYTADFLQSVYRSWEMARRITNQPTPRWPFSDLESPWIAYANLLQGGFSLTGSPSFGNSTVDFANAVTEYAHTQSLSFEVLNAIEGIATGSEVLESKLRGTREQRVEIFEDAMRSTIHARHSYKAADGFLLGFLASQIGPGTLDHIGLLAPAKDAVPSAYLWYGLFAGLSNDGNLDSFSKGLGRWVRRELLRRESASDRPTHDISIRELNVLAGASQSSLDFRTAQVGFLDVELIPLVTTRLKWGRRESTLQDRPQDEFSQDYLLSLLKTSDRLFEDTERLRQILKPLLSSVTASRSQGGKKRRK